ncbi:MAG: hypothetical protein GY754_22390 [bacterium]|nr:hypothetical protein [bacterium]
MKHFLAFLILLIFPIALWAEETTIDQSVYLDKYGFKIHGEYKYIRGGLSFRKMSGKTALNGLRRPGPYFTNEYDGGGVPAWVFKNTTKKTKERDGWDRSQGLACPWFLDSPHSGHVDGFKSGPFSTFSGCSEHKR